MDGGPSGRPDQISQLVERAKGLGASRGNRSGRIARVVDGKFSLDASGKDRHAASAKTDERFREIAALRSKVAARVSQGRQLWRSLSARRRRDDENLARRRGRNPRSADRWLGLKHLRSI